MQAKSSGCLLGNSIPAHQIGYLGILRKGMTMDINAVCSKRATVHAALIPLVPSPVQGVAAHVGSYGS